jgi:dolichyl-phosphate beta-glucosyltransferase
MQADLALVIPTYNEERRIPEALARLEKLALSEGISLLVVVADDGSKDATVEIVRDWADRADPNKFGISFVRLQHRGKGAAVRAGMAVAEAPVVGYVDADLSAGADAILELYRHILDGADVAISSRAIQGSVLVVRQPWLRERAGRLFNLLLRKLTRIPYRDTQCGLKLFRVEAAKKIFRYQRLDGFAFDAELAVIAYRLGLDIDEVAISWSHSADSRVSMLVDSIRMLRDALVLGRRARHGDLHEPGVPSQIAMEMMIAAEDHHWWHISKRNLISGLLEAHEAPEPYLDVGCGGGALLSTLGRHGTVMGVDLSPDALAYARGRGIDRLIESEAQRLPFRAGSFGTIMTLDVLEHHVDPEAMLVEIHRILDQDGRLVVTVPAYRWMWSYADELLGHYRRYTRPQLRAQLARTGFEVQRISYFHAWLLPVAWVFRKARRLVGRADSADDFPLPGPLNRLLLGLAALERKILDRVDLPFGLSIVAVARKPAP